MKKRIRLAAILILNGLSLTGGPSYAAEFEVLDRFSVDGYTVLRGSADIPGGSFAVGGSAFVVKNGNIGIGTTAPISPLHVHNAGADTSSYARFTNESTGAGAGNGFLIGVDATNEYRMHGNGNTPLKIFTNNLERVRVDGSGNVSMGTAGSITGGRIFWVYNGDTGAGSFVQSYIDTDAGYLTQMVGSIANGGMARVYSGATGGLYIYTAGATQLQFGVNSAEVMRISAAGNVGIGTAAPGEKLTIAGAGTTYVAGITTDGASQRGLVVRNSQTATTSGGTGPAIILQNTSGTANNFAALAFAGTGGTIGYISGQITDHTNAYGNLVFTTRGADGWSDRMTVSSAGNVSIGTLDSNAKLEIAGMGAANATAIRIDSQDTYKRDILFTEFNTTAYGGIIRYDSGGDIFQLLTLENSVEKPGVAIARATGNVGIGTTAPGQKLSVAGTIESTSGGVKFPDGSIQAASAIFTKSFTSAELTKVDGGAQTVAHGLGGVPILISGQAKCVVADAGYSVGDIVNYDFGADKDGARGTSIVLDATNITIRFHSGGTLIPHKTSTTNSGMTSASWRYIIRAFR